MWLHLRKNRLRDKNDDGLQHFTNLVDLGEFLPRFDRSAFATPSGVR